MKGFKCLFLCEVGDALYRRNKVTELELEGGFNDCSQDVITTI